MNTIKTSLIRFLTLTLMFTVSAGVYANNQDLPSAKALFAKHIEAVGGEHAIRANNSRTITGSFSMPAMGINGALHVVGSAPNKMNAVVDLGQMGNSIDGYNGTVGWSMNGMTGNQLLKGDALKVMQMRADFYSDLNLAGDSVKQETVEIAIIDGEENYRVLLVAESGNERFLFFSKVSGLLTGKESMEKTPYGILPTLVKIGDYTQFGDLKIARNVTTNQGGVDSIIYIDSVSFDAVAEGSFDIPAEIQAMMK